MEIFNRVFGNWQKQYGDEFLEKVRIVVTGSPMPRKQILAVSYFARKLKQIGESARLV